MSKEGNRYTSADIDVAAIKEQSRRSGLSYNEAKDWIAKNMGGRGTNIFSDTDVEEVRRQNQASMNNRPN
ncbi:hypothetical protein SAMN05216389_106229 [Oceanobacillus limi]|uniref:Small, acid-soluble spore protein gamma-type n=1 Tax=Oceanobacillus limi TaxID=930131 RepID=A0A1I0CI02_9BACI|nr:hypothetical protein [Oceanobacillus limi]SET18768.1 hypothetical protein SAMN05216389_106229 [Oceanobacillus limi]